ncbi:MAG: hypothetical protein K0S65_6722, partial [Labilithrix sp.]|nr:hypothetical protein [Labilithrix sp.]
MLVTSRFELSRPPMKRSSKTLVAALVPLTLFTIVAACSSAEDPVLIDGPDTGTAER